jgi:hypothetical protein
MKKYTTEEIREEFGDTQILLTSYYKYVFGYEGIKDGKRIHVEVGGNSDDIYRFEPLINATESLEKLMKEMGICRFSVWEGSVQLGEYYD